MIRKSINSIPSDKGNIIGYLQIKKEIKPDRRSDNQKRMKDI